MNKDLYNDANQITNYSINEILPDKAIKKALLNYSKPKGRTILLSIGKAAYQMAKEIVLNIEIDKGIVITKYNHSKEPIQNIKIYEAGHPIVDENSIKATREAIDMCSNLTEDDLVILSISGGGSSLFENPLIELNKLKEVNNKLLKCSASIEEINTIRKRLSRVKGGKFGELCKPAKVMNIILSDIINDPLDMIASGPTYPDSSSSKEAINIINKYSLNFDQEIINLLNKETIKYLNNIESYIIGNNKILKSSAKKKAEDLGYKVINIEKPLTCNIDEAVSIFKMLLDKHINEHNVCIIAGGEIVLEVKGNGLGGRNQELACRMAKYMKDNVCFFAIGSDGTDGPTDAAGGYVDKNIFNSEIDNYINNNDSYHYLEKYEGLIKTGPTGSNVNDLYCLLIK